MYTELRSLERKQYLTILAVALVLSGLLVLPILAQKFLGIDAVKTAFVVIVLYAIINYYLKNKM